MKIKDEIQKVWVKEFDSLNLSTVARELGLSVLTVRNAVYKGVCSQKSMDLINNYILNRREKMLILLSDE
jgi:hypothetical protein